MSSMADRNKFLQDDLGDMFQSAGGIKFDLELSDNENMAIAMTKCEKVCWAYFSFVCLRWWEKHLICSCAPDH